MPRALGWLLAAVLALSYPLAPSSGRADQYDTRLESLFERLQITSDPADAAALQQRIWQIWIEFEDPAVNEMMRQGVTAMARGEHEAALDRFDRMVKQAPDFAEAWNKRATVLYLMGRFEESVFDIQHTLELEPRHFGALSGLGLIYEAVQKPAAAIRSFEAALEINPHLQGTRERIADLKKKLEGRKT